MSKSAEYQLEKIIKGVVGDQIEAGTTLTKQPDGSWSMEPPSAQAVIVGDGSVSPAFIATFKAGENIALFRVLRLVGDEVFVFNANDRTQVGLTVGVAITSASTGEDVQVVMRGEYAHPTLNLPVAVGELFVGAGGVVSNIAGSQVVQSVGFAINADRMLVDVGLPFIQSPNAPTLYQPFDQVIRINGTPTGGTFTITRNGVTVTLPHAPTSQEWGEAFLELVPETDFSINADGSGSAIHVYICPPNGKSIAKTDFTINHSGLTGGTTPTVAWDGGGSDSQSASNHLAPLGTVWTKCGEGEAASQSPNTETYVPVILDADLTYGGTVVYARKGVSSVRSWTQVE